MVIFAENMTGPSNSAITEGLNELQRKPRGELEFAGDTGKWRRQARPPDLPSRLPAQPKLPFLQLSLTPDGHSPEPHFCLYKPEAILDFCLKPYSPLPTTDTPSSQSPSPLAQSPK